MSSDERRSIVQQLEFATSFRSEPSGPTTNETDASIEVSKIREFAK